MNPWSCLVSQSNLALWLYYWARIPCRVPWHLPTLGERQSFSEAHARVKVLRFQQFPFFLWQHPTPPDSRISGDLPRQCKLHLGWLQREEEQPVSELIPPCAYLRAILNAAYGIGPLALFFHVCLGNGCNAPFASFRFPSGAPLLCVAWQLPRHPLAVLWSPCKPLPSLTASSLAHLVGISFLLSPWGFHVTRFLSSVCTLHWDVKRSKSKLMPLKGHLLLLLFLTGCHAYSRSVVKCCCFCFMYELGLHQPTGRWKAPPTTSLATYCCSALSLWQPSLSPFPWKRIKGGGSGGGGGSSGWEKQPELCTVGPCEHVQKTYGWRGHSKYVRGSTVSFFP